MLRNGLSCLFKKSLSGSLIFASSYFVISHDNKYLDQYRLGTVYVNLIPNNQNIVPIKNKGFQFRGILKEFKNEPTDCPELKSGKEFITSLIEEEPITTNFIREYTYENNKHTVDRIEKTIFDNAVEQKIFDDVLDHLIQFNGKLNVNEMLSYQNMFLEKCKYNDYKTKRHCERAINAYFLSLYFKNRFNLFL